MELARLGDDARVGGEDAVDVRVDLAGVRAERRGERDGGRVGAAAAERRDVERRSRRPGSRRRARSCPSSSASWIRRARTSTIFALPCAVSVTIPACEPVSEIASWPRSWIAIATSAQEIRSPTEISMSSSRGSGRGETSCARREQLVGGVAHRRERRRRRGCPPRAPRRAGGRPPGSARGRRRTCRRTSSRPCQPSRRPSPATAGTASYWRSCAVCLHLPAAGQRPAQRDLVCVLEIAADRRPLARRVTRTRPRRRSAMNAAVASPVMFGLVASTTSSTPFALDAAEQLVDAEVLGLDAVERRERAAEHVVQAAVLVRALERDEVGRLLDDADERVGRAGRRGRSRRSPPRSGCRTRGRSERAPWPRGSPSASASASSLGARRRWNASRCAVRVPTPGRRVSWARGCRRRGSYTGQLCRIAAGRARARGPAGRGRPGRAAQPRLARSFADRSASLTAARTSVLEHLGVVRVDRLRARSRSSRSRPRRSPSL